MLCFHLKLKLHPTSPHPAGLLPPPLQLQLQLHLFPLPRLRERALAGPVPLIHTRQMGSCLFCLVFFFSFDACFQSDYVQTLSNLCRVVVPESLSPVHVTNSSQHGGPGRHGPPAATHQTLSKTTTFTGLHRLCFVTPPS